jgi:hypothetical protein
MAISAFNKTWKNEDMNLSRKSKMKSVLGVVRVQKYARLKILKWLIINQPGSISVKIVLLAINGALR